MGQLTNQFVSQSYQGILNLANANTGFTTNLQTITDGLGGSSPLQISQTQVNISGTFTVNGSPVSADTGSLVTTSSFNAFTSSVDLRFDGIELETGSLQNQINQKLDTGSFNAYTSSNDSKVNSLINATGSYATTSSLTALSQSVAATDLAQDNRLTAIESITGSLATTGSLNSYTLTSSFNAYTSSNDSKVNSIISKTGSYATTGSNQFNGNQSISGSVQASSNITTLGGFVGTSYGSTVNATIYGDQLVDIKTQTTSNNGKVRLYSNGNYPFKVEVSGSLNVRDGITGSLQGTASYATQALSASWAPDNSNRNGLITTGSAGGTQYITGSLNVEGTISATSASFTYVNTVYETASVIYSSGSNQFGDASNDTQTLYGTVNLPNGPLVITGSVTSTGGFTGSLQGTASNAISSSHAINADTASFVQNAISSSYATNAATASIAYDVVVYGKCDNPGGLTRGTIVRITGANGDNPLFNTASWEDDANSANTLGMLSEDVVHNGFANVVVQGKVIGINTQGMSPGSLLFLSSSGQYTTSSVPAPYHEVRLGQVLRDNINQGSAYITIDNGYELTELHDVDIQSVQVGDVLTYVSGAYGQWVNKTVDELGYLQTSSFNTYSGNTLDLINQKLDTGSFNTYTASMDARTGSYITTGSIATTQAITGSVIVSGSETITGSLGVRNGNLNLVSNNTTINTSLYLTNSLAGQSNMIFGWGDNPTAGGAGATQANYTGSLRITGSNNIIAMPLTRPTALGGTADMTHYISGSGNIMLNNNNGIMLNTGSLLLPKVASNILGVNASIIMNFTTSSLAGGHPNFVNNLIMGGNIQSQHPSGSVSFATNAIIGGSIASTQNFVTNTRPAMSGNNVIGQVTLNHISSSINYQQNYNNCNVLVNNHLSSSAHTNNRLDVNNNIFLGGSTATGVNIWVSGSQSANVSRGILDNIIGGKNLTVSSSFISSSASSLLASVIYGQGLSVNGNSSNGNTSGGSAFLGRFNDTGSLANSNDIVLAVGTGTGTANRRTGMWITSGSAVGISGSMHITGSVNINNAGPVNISGSQFNTNNFMVWNGSPNVAGTLDNFVGAFMVDRNAFVFNNIVQAALTSGSNFTIATNTGSNYTNQVYSCKWAGTETSLTVGNSNGYRYVEMQSDNITVTGSMKLSTVMNMRPLDPLPAGNIGDLAVSSSNQLYFYNGAWTLVV